MKKNRFLLFLFLYGAVFIFTLIAQWIHIHEIRYKIVVNICTAVLGLFSLVMFRILYQKDKPAIEMPDKEQYLDFSRIHALSKREREIGWLLLNGYSNLELAESLYISVTTVKKHLTHLYEKAGVSGRKKFRERVAGHRNLNNNG
jgi:DNA-binding CsgD family transcriptional regulator